MSGDDKVKLKILIADDSRLVRASFVRYLSEEFDIHQCEDGEQALALLEEAGDFSLVFSDLSMPRMDGYTLLDRIRNNDNASLRDIPVVIVTGKEDAEQDKDRIVGLGATDLISKPFHSAELLSRARGYATLRRKVEKLEQKIPVDSVTGLVTRDYFLEQGNKQLALAKRQGFKMTVARFDVTNLQLLKQEFGVPLVAKMMAVVAKTLQDNIRTEDIAAYLGTGKFALLLPGSDPQATVQVWARLRNRIANFELKIGERKASLLFASGLASQRIDAQVVDFTQLLQQAEDSLVGSKSETGTVSGASNNAPPAADESVAVSIDALLEKLRANEVVEPVQTISAMRALVPLLKLANSQMSLDMEPFIQAVVAQTKEKTH